MGTLTQIGNRNYTDKGNIGFLDTYEEVWGEKFPRTSSPILLEIGVYNGNSMRTWCEWFPDATIVGIDLHAQPRGNESRAILHYGNQADPIFLHEVASKYEHFDIIIDDGGHIWNEQQISFEVLWPYVSAGGLYIIEDLQTSNDPFWRGPNVDQVNTVEYLASIARDLVIHGSPTIKSIGFYNGLAIFTKKV